MLMVIDLKYLKILYLNNLKKIFKWLQTFFFHCFE